MAYYDNSYVEYNEKGISGLLITSRIDKHMFVKGFKNRLICTKMKFDFFLFF